MLPDGTHFSFDVRELVAHSDQLMLHTIIGFNDVTDRSHDPEPPYHTDHRKGAQHHGLHPHPIKSQQVMSRDTQDAGRDGHEPSGMEPPSKLI